MSSYAWINRLINLVSASLPPCFARWTQSFLSDRRACVVFQNHKSRSFLVRRGVPQRSILGPALFSPLIIFLLLCLPSAALFTLTIWPFGSSPPRSPLRWRPYKELCLFVCGYSSSSSGWRYGMNGNLNSCRQPN